MKNVILSLIVLSQVIVACAHQDGASRRVELLDTNWQFINKDVNGAEKMNCNTADWENVTVPHDWAIKGPFDEEVDKQSGIIRQNNEKIATEKTGRTGALPHVGVGWYRKFFSVPDYQLGKKVLLTFDGAMSQPQVFINGTKVGEWKNSYNYFYFDISQYLQKGENLLAVRLENLPYSSRWYPGAGLYRKVQLVVKDEVSFKHWGHFITTPRVSNENATINIKSKLNGNGVLVKAVIKDAEGNIVAQSQSDEITGDEIEQELIVKNPAIWDIDTPNLYYAELSLYHDDMLKDKETVRFGIRKIEYNADKGGFLLNDRVTKFKGVCLHHDLGPLGAAINKAALKRQLTILKDMGCNAIRSSHNMPSLEQLELCDEMGFLFLAESFDEWKKPKMKNGYNLFFDEWAEKDVVNLVHATRNHPCIVMWSSGNEVPDQLGKEGVARARWLQDIFHREDPTRPVTVGMDQVKATMKSGFGAVMDIPGLNYRVHLYEEAYEKFPQGMLLGSETASTLSSRGFYRFPVVEVKDDYNALKAQKEAFYGDTYQCSSYDLEYCGWSNLPDDDFILQDDKPWVIGEFVWTGFDYLGEPTPFDQFWPSRSSYFGICDLAGLPKDRYYLYRSRWNTKDETLHVLPHWNWEGREGQITPVFVYTNYNSAELFVNGVSQGVQTKTKNKSKQERYRLMWMDVKYQPGTIKVVAFDDYGKPAAEKEIHTAGEPHHFELSADRNEIEADGRDLSYITVSVVDKDGNLCPQAQNQLIFEVSGAGQFKAVCNGDATSLEMFHKPTMKAFNGQLVVTVQSLKAKGDITLKVNGQGLQTVELTIKSE
ncbi:glycoside hydrolase family 2 protein [Labilibacter sediminis]|nr:glycoside hydrolase family 2 protein [Labilibacter sediminis]